MKVTMLPYGNSKRDNLCNRRGCCGQCRKHKDGKFPVQFVREGRKRARTQAKKEIRQDV